MGALFVVVEELDLLAHVIQREVEWEWDALAEALKEADVEKTALKQVEDLSNRMAWGKTKVAKSCDHS